jgi:uncharacterized membrane protein YpjA
MGGAADVRKQAMMREWFRDRASMVHRWVETPQILALIVALDFAAYVGGLLFWYGAMMGDPATPVWAWPFVPDCPLFGLLGGIGLLMAIGQTWTEAAQVQTQRALLVTGTLVGALFLSTYLPGVTEGWAQQAGLMGLLSGLLLLNGFFFRRVPIWLLGLFAFGQIKYGLWTITAWLLFWRSTAEILGAPLFSAESILMTVSHVGLAAQGILLLTYLTWKLDRRLTVTAALASLLWFGLSDYVDYGLGFFPPIPQDLISLSVMQWSTIAVTWLVGALYWWIGWQNRPVLSGEHGASRLAA